MRGRPGTLLTASKSEHMKIVIIPVLASLSFCGFALAAHCQSVQSAQNSPASSSAKDPATLPFHDSHQGFTVAADPVLKADEYKSRFGKKTPYDAGIIAIDAYFRNDTDKPVQIKLEDIRLTMAVEGEEQQDLPALNSREVASASLHEGGKEPSRHRLPIPGVGGNHGKEWQQLEATLHAAGIQSDTVGPHSTVHGLLYFDLDARFDLIGNTRLYVPNLKFYASDQALLYFEVPLRQSKQP